MFSNNVHQGAFPTLPPMYDPKPFIDTTSLQHMIAKSLLGRPGQILAWGRRSGTDVIEFHYCAGTEHSSARRVHTESIVVNPVYTITGIDNGTVQLAVDRCNELMDEEPTRYINYPHRIVALIYRTLGEVIHEDQLLTVTASFQAPPTGGYGISFSTKTPCLDGSVVNTVYYPLELEQALVAEPGVVPAGIAKLYLDYAITIFNESKFAAAVTIDNDHWQRTIAGLFTNALNGVIVGLSETMGSGLANLIVSDCATAMPGTSVICKLVSGNDHRDLPVYGPLEPEIYDRFQRLSGSVFTPFPSRMLQLIFMFGTIGRTATEVIETLEAYRECTECDVQTCFYNNRAPWGPNDYVLRGNSGLLAGVAIPSNGVWARSAPNYSHAADTYRSAVMKEGDRYL